MGGLVGATGALALVLAPTLAPPSPRAAPSAVPHHSADAAPPSVQWGGCAEVQLHDDMPVCHLDPDGSLRLWVEARPTDALQVALDGRDVAAEVYAVEGESGHGLRVPVPEGSRALTLHRGPAASSTAVWSLALGSAGAPRPEALAAARTELRNALGRDDPEATRQATRVAFERTLAHGRLSEAVDLGLAVALALSQQRSGLTAAQAVLDMVEDAAQRYPKGRGDLAAYRGLHQWYRGAIQDAAESLRDATRVAVRLEDPELSADAIPMYAETLAELGYFEDARRWAREGLRIVRGRRPACDLGSALRTVGWLNLLLQQRGRPHDDPTPFLLESLEVFGPQGPCPRPDKRGGARLSLAMLALDGGELPQAAAELARIDRATLPVDERVHVDDLEVRLSLARDDPAAARRALERLRHSATAADTADARWRLHTREGRLLEREGRGERAVEAYREAETELDVLMRLQAVGIGRGALADRYHESTAALISRLVEHGDPDQAWCIARQAKARRRTAAAAPSALDPAARARLDDTIERYRWHKLQAELLRSRAQALPRDEMQGMERAADEARERARALANELAKSLGQLAPHPRCTELSPPEPGELLVGIHPHEHEWLLFAHDGSTTTVHALVPPDPDDGPAALAGALLTPLDAPIEAAVRIRVLAHHEAQPIDLHALPWRGAPLGTQRPVSYGVELPAAPRPAASRRPQRALLIADPTDTLERAPAEVAWVDERLSAAGWSTSVISVGHVPRPGRVSLAGYDLFHYAGHAEASARPSWGGWPPYEGGSEGWAAFLELGRAGRLTVHDVLTMRPAPRAAVLAGCRTGVRQLDTGETSMALALLVAGSEQVIASADAVEDEHGSRFARQLYEEIGHEAPIDLVLAMQHAQRSQWHARAELAPYRVWVR